MHPDLVTGLLTLAGVIVGSFIAGGFGGGLTTREIDFLFPTIGNVAAPTTTELNAD